MSNTILPSRQIENAQIAGSAGINAVRTFPAAVTNTWTLTSDGAGKLTVDESLMAQSVAFSSGLATAVTAATTKSFKASQATWELPSGASLPSKVPFHPELGYSH